MGARCRGWKKCRTIILPAGCCCCDTRPQSILGGVTDRAGKISNLTGGTETIALLKHGPTKLIQNNRHLQTRNMNSRHVYYKSTLTKQCLPGTLPAGRTSSTRREENGRNGLWGMFWKRSARSHSTYRFAKGQQQISMCCIFLVQRF